MSVSIRPFTSSDLSDLKQLIHGTIDVSYADAYPPRARDYFKSFHSDEAIVERSEKGLILMAESPETGALVGTGSMVDQDIFALFVSPDHQGEGIGKRLMERLESRAVESGMTLAELHVSLPSKAFYENLGYTMLEACAVDVGEGQELKYWRAEKRLVP